MRLRSWWLTLRLSLLPALLLMLLNLRPLLIHLLPFTPQLLSLLLWPRVITLDAPGSLSFPMSVSLPGPPVPMQSLRGDPLIMPRVPVPIALPVISSPARVHIKIETRNTAIITPAAVIIMGAIPAAFPRTPPPATPEKQVYVYFGNHIHIRRVRQDDHFRRRLKYDRRRQTNINAHTHLRHR